MVNKTLFIYHIVEPDLKKKGQQNRGDCFETGLRHVLKTCIGG